MLGLGTKLTKSKVVAPGIVTDGLVMKHMYPAGAVQLLSDGAVYFNSSNVHIDLGSQANTGDDITFGAWVNFTDTGVHPVVYFGDFLVQFSDDTTFRIYPDAGAGGASSAQIPSVLNNWTYITAVVDDNIAHHYYNGVLKETDTGLGTLSTDTNIYSSLGKAATSYMGGYMCNAAIWSRVLTQSEIKSIMWKQYADLTSSEKTSLVSWWNLDEAYDSSSFVLDNHHGGGDTLSSNLWDNSATVSTGSGWTWDGSVGHAQSDDTDAGDFKQAESIEGDTVYKTVFTISDYVKGQVRIKLTSANDSNDYYGTGTTRSANGTYTEYIRTSSTGASENFEHITFQTYGSTDDNFKVSDIQIYKVNGNTGTLS